MIRPGWRLTVPDDATGVDQPPTPAAPFPPPAPPSEPKPDAVPDQADPPVVTGTAASPKEAPLASETPTQGRRLREARTERFRGGRQRSQAPLTTPSHGSPLPASPPCSLESPSPGSGAFEPTSSVTAAVVGTYCAQRRVFGRRKHGSGPSPTRTPSPGSTPPTGSCGEACERPKPPRFQR